MTALPARYAFLNHEIGPPLLLEALKEYGTLEVPGVGNNPKILGWADEVGATPGMQWIADFYKADQTPWCGLFMGVVAKRAGLEIQQDLLAARGWLDWGFGVAQPMLGDVLVFWRGNPQGQSGHVGIYVGEDAETYHVLGGNQSDAVNIMRLDRGRLLAARKPGGPHALNRRPITLGPEGPISGNES